MTTSTNSQEVINFGKHKGTALIDLDRAYVRWLLKQENLNGDLRKSLESLPWVKGGSATQRIGNRPTTYTHSTQRTQSF